MVWPAVIAAGASLAGTATSAFGASKANSLQSRMIDRQHEFAAGEAKKSRRFQERMSRHSYRYGMEDMRKAGLNPILAYSQAGSSTPSGANASSGSGGKFYNVGEAAPGTVSTAMAAREAYIRYQRAQAEIKNINTDTDLKDMQEVKTKVEAAKTIVEGRNAITTGKGLKADLEKKEATADVYKNIPWLRYIDEIGRSLNPFASGAGNVGLKKGK